MIHIARFRRICNPAADSKSAASATRRQSSAKPVLRLTLTASLATLALMLALPFAHADDLTPRPPLLMTVKP
jgi:hypothetical protein